MRVAQVASEPLVLDIVDANDITFSHVSTRNALSQMRVAQILEDDQGFIWLGTQYGLNRYDGYEYKVFAHDPEQRDSLSGVYIRSLFKDRTGALWVGTEQSLDRFDPTTERFSHYKLTRSDSSPLPVTVFHISQDSRGMLWLATGYGLYGLDPGTGRRVHFVRSAGDPRTLMSNNVKFTGEDAQGRFWVVNDGGLDQLDRSNGTVLLHVPLNESREMSFVEDGQGNLWIPHASGAGLALFEPSNNRLVPVVFGNLSADDAGIPSMAGGLRTRDGTLWFASAKGLLKLDLPHRRLLRYRHYGGDAQSITADNVTTLYEDRESHVWLGLHAAAPNFFATNPSGFQKLPYGPAPPRTAGMVDMVNSIYQARDQSLWISYLGMLARVDRRQNQVTYYAETERGAAADIISTLEDTSGRLWFGTVGGGLAKFEQQSGKFSWLRHDPRNSDSLSNDVVTRLFVDHSGRFWATTWDGLDLFQPDSGRFRTYRPDTETAAQMYVGIAQDLRGALWLGSMFSGLHRFDPVTGQFTIYRHDDANKDTLSNDRVNHVYVDKAGMVWAGTQEGLSRFDPAKGSFSNWTERDGLPGNVVSCILEDEGGQLWLSTNKGLARFQPDTGQFRNFTVADGLPGNDFTGWSACFRTGGGEMFFGGFNGAIAFLPREIREQATVPRVALTELDVAGVPVRAASGAPLTRSIGFTQQITLAPEQNNFAVGFTALSFGSPATNRYRYKLEGLEQQWNQVSADRRLAAYTTLPAGHYTLRVSASTARGPWSEPGVALDITILPHWWATWWFRSLAALAWVLVMMAAYHAHMRKIASQFEIRIDERGRIARNLHDSLLQGFQALLYCVQAARDLLPSRPNEAIGILETALERGDRAIAEGRDTVHDLRSTVFVDPDFGKTLKQLAEEMAATHQSARPPTCRVLIEGQPRALDTTVRDEVYKIAREAFRNAFRHADARLVEAEIEYDERQFVLRVRDDGTGIDPDVLQHGRRAGHWGLPGMRERSESLGGQLAVWSEREAGTEVELKIPAAIAYLRKRRAR